MMYDCSHASDFHTSQSESMGALNNMVQNSFSGIYNTFPGPYHPTHLACVAQVPALRRGGLPTRQEAHRSVDHIVIPTSLVRSDNFELARACA